jgi:Protein of unknown function (DUF2911)
MIQILRVILIAAALSAGSTSVKAQSAMLNLPRASQHARVSQRIGVTDITIDYHRPRVNGRKIFGVLQAYGQVWRAGANENTVIEFSEPVSIQGQPLGKGAYGLHMIPGPTSWVVIFSKNSTSWGSFTYNEAEDALRVIVTGQTVENQEVLRYEFEDPTPNSAVIAMRWENVQVAFKVGVNTPETVSQSLRKQLRSRVQFEWQPWMEAADYLLDNKLSAEEASKYADLSIQNEDRFENEFVKARALSVLGQKQRAVEAREKALALGTQLQIQSYARGLQAQGRKDEALELFRLNIKKDPNSWIAHNESARIATASGDFDTAVKEMKLALAGAPDTLKPLVEELIRLLEKKVDIN